MQQIELFVGETLEIGDVTVTIVDIEEDQIVFRVDERNEGFELAGLEPGAFVSLPR